MINNKLFSRRLEAVFSSFNAVFGGGQMHYYAHLEVTNQALSSICRTQ